MGSVGEIQRGEAKDEPWSGQRTETSNKHGLQGRRYVRSSEAARGLEACGVCLQLKICKISTKSCSFTLAQTVKCQDLCYA